MHCCEPPRADLRQSAVWQRLPSCWQRLPPPCARRTECHQLESPWSSPPAHTAACPWRHPPPLSPQRSASAHRTPHTRRWQCESRQTLGSAWSTALGRGTYGGCVVGDGGQELLRTLHAQVRTRPGRRAAFPPLTGRFEHTPLPSRAVSVRRTPPERVANPRSAGRLPSPTLDHAAASRSVARHFAGVKEAACTT
jgi:hypothetical protein